MSLPLSVCVDVSVSLCLLATMTLHLCVFYWPWKAVIWHSSPTVLLPYTLPGTTPFGRSLTWLPTLLPAFTFSSAWLVSEKRRPAPSPTLVSIVHCWQASQYITKTMTSSRKLGPEFSLTNSSEEKGLACFSPFPFRLPSLLYKLPDSGLQARTSLKQARCQWGQKGGIWMTVTVCQTKNYAHGSEWTSRLFDCLSF